MIVKCLTYYIYLPHDTKSPALSKLSLVCASSSHHHLSIYPCLAYLSVHGNEAPVLNIPPQLEDADFAVFK